MREVAPSVPAVVSENKLTYKQFVSMHAGQLERSNVPRYFWPGIHYKCAKKVFDAGNVMKMFRVDYEDFPVTERHLPFRAYLTLKVMDPRRSEFVYLIDHAWKFSANEARNKLRESVSLQQRMKKIVGFKDDEEVSVEQIFNRLWRFCNTYSILNGKTVESRLPVWYMMDELGSAMNHSADPTFRMFPLLYVPDNIFYSIIFPAKKLYFGDQITIDYTYTTDPYIKDAMMLPWVEKSFIGESFAHFQPDWRYFAEGHTDEGIPNDLQPPTPKQSFKVYSDYSFVNEYLKDSRFEIVTTEAEADILWVTQHFKKFDQINSMGKYINQFPYEFVLTIKDLLAITCRRRNLRVEETWLPITYNLRTELNQFTAYYEYRKANELDNHWIIKPFNLARGLDIHITDNLNFILRLTSTQGPKIAQKYIENPILFNRLGIGKVKFDIRYVILLKSSKPLQVYVYKNFFLRFANQPYALTNLDSYEQHFTVMNYRNDSDLKHMTCAEFRTHWEQQYNITWRSIEENILQMFSEVFDCATMEVPPCGIAPSQYSRALYAADLMLEWNLEEIQPKLLEINWTPDCQRACEYYPEFYNDIFKLLFLNIENTDVFHKL